MTKEQEIYKNMRKKGRIMKSHNKWVIRASKLMLAISEAGYEDIVTQKQIIQGMIDKGYLRESKDVWGRTARDQGLTFLMGNFIIEKWVDIEDEE